MFIHCNKISFYLHKFRISTLLYFKVQVSDLIFIELTFLTMRLLCIYLVFQQFVYVFHIVSKLDLQLIKHAFQLINLFIFRLTKITSICVLRKLILLHFNIKLCNLILQSPDLKQELFLVSFSVFIYSYLILYIFTSLCELQC